jgi:hypothetical protein
MKVEKKEKGAGADESQDKRRAGTLGRTVENQEGAGVLKASKQERGMGS